MQLCRTDPNHNALNQLLSDSHKQYSYHPNGNLAQIKGQEDIDFQYDALDRLVVVVKGNTKACYTYDHFHRRIKKEIFVEGISQQVQHFLYVGQDEIGAVENGQITELRILGDGHGAEIGSAIAIELQNRILIPIHNMRGDICCLVDSETKEIVQSCQYSAFGEQSADSIIPWGFSSKRLDPETGFIYFGRRYYSPQLGRWITPDPIGFRDGPNLYAYVHNSPLTNFDLYGLFAMESSYSSNSNLPYFQYSMHNYNRSYQNSYWGSTNYSSQLNRPRESFFTSTRFQGAMQAFGGFMEASAGAALAYTPFAPVGFAIMAHGADHFAAGGYAMVTGRYRATGTEQLLQKTGMSPGWASFSDSALSIGSFTGAIGLSRYSAYQSSRAISHAAMNSFEVSASKTEMIFSKTPFHQAASQLSETGQNNIRILRGWAKSKGWKMHPNANGRPEMWGQYTGTEFNWNLKIKPIGSMREGLQSGSNLPRFEARLYENTGYINPFTGKIGNKSNVSHNPLEEIYY